MPIAHVPGLFLRPCSFPPKPLCPHAVLLPLPIKALPAFIEKAIQLYEMVVVRHGLMLVGQSFGMKTSSIRVLAAALGDMNAAGEKARGSWEAEGGEGKGMVLTAELGDMNTAGSWGAG